MLKPKTIDFKIKRNLTEEESAAFDVIKKLQEAGFEAYFAGGAVRDELLGLDAHDIDIATSAKPEEIEKIFPKTFARGKAFGVMAVRVGDCEFEVATFRKDIGIADHRRPESVEFTTAEGDALRRDFTINALFYDPIANKIIDFVNGLEDLDKKIIRFVGDPEERIEEDYLRMLRGVRFTARFNFTIEPDSWSAIKNNSHKINQISIERIRDEISKMLLLDNRVLALELLSESGLLKEVLSELEVMKNVPQPPEFHAEGDVWTHTMLALKNVGHPSAGGNSEELVWTVLLHDIAKPETLGTRDKPGRTSITFFEHDTKGAVKAAEILERLRFSHQFIDSVSWAISQHMRIVSAFRGMSERKKKKLFCDPRIELLLELTRADLSASLRPDKNPEMDMYKAAVLLKEKCEKEMSEEERRQVRKFDLITGKDIMDILEIAPSPQIGQIKSEIEQAYLDGKINTRKEALKMMEKYRERI